MELHGDSYYQQNYVNASQKFCISPAQKKYRWQWTERKKPHTNGKENMEKYVEKTRIHTPHTYQHISLTIQHGPTHNQLNQKDAKIELNLAKDYSAQNAMHAW